MSTRTSSSSPYLSSCPTALLRSSLPVRFASSYLPRSYALRLFGSSLFVGACAFIAPFSVFSVTGNPELLRLALLAGVLCLGVGLVLGLVMLVMEYDEWARPRRAAHRLFVRRMNEYREARRRHRRAMRELEQVLARQRAAR